MTVSDPISVVESPTDQQSRRWFYAPPIASPRHRLFCFAYAGGSATIYRGWIDALAAKIEVCPIELPGRWSRVSEEPYTSMDDLQADLLPALAPHLDQPFSLFGYSLGGLVAYELARTLRRELGVQPTQLLIAARPAPQQQRSGTLLGDLPDAELVRQLGQRYAPIPAPILRDREMLELVLRITRADVRIFESYQHRPEPPLQCPITVFGGDRDRSASVEALQAWSLLTTGEFALRLFPGDHFFINTCGPQLIDSVRAQLDPSAR